MPNKNTKRIKFADRSKLIITFALLLFATSPFALLYSGRLFFWIECSGKTHAAAAGWERCGGMGIQYIFYALVVAILMLLASALLMLYATRSKKTKQ